MTEATSYGPYELVIGQSTENPRLAWGIECLIECECPDCIVGQHLVDAFGRGSSQGWYDTRDQAQAVVEKLSGRS